MCNQNPGNLAEKDKKIGKERADRVVVRAKVKLASEGDVMFRDLRHKGQELSSQEIEEILLRNTSGVFALAGEDYPYAYPMSYLYYEGKLYFHCEKKGHKIDHIMNNDRVSFCVVDQDRIVADEFTSYYKSVILFGRARPILDEKKKLRTIRLLSDKFSPDREIEREEIIKKYFPALEMIEVEIEHLQGKQAAELVSSPQNP